MSLKLGTRNVREYIPIINVNVVGEVAGLICVHCVGEMCWQKERLSRVGFKEWEMRYREAK